MLRLQHARGLLCGLGAAGGAAVGGTHAAAADESRQVVEFNRIAQRVLQAPDWCARCDATCQQRVLPKWLFPEQLAEQQQSAGRRGWWRARGPEWCMRTPPPPQFEAGACVLNVAARPRP